MRRTNEQYYHCLLKNENYIDPKYILMFFLSQVNVMSWISYGQTVPAAVTQHAIGVKLVLLSRFLST